MDALVWGLPVLLFLLICPLMMVGMGLAAWFGVRFLGRTTGQNGHDSHACGPMMMMGHAQTGARPGGGHGEHGAAADDEVSALRARVDDLERRLSEARTTPTSGPSGRSS
jgi:hypothetical protein